MNTKTLLFAVAAMTLAACSNDNEATVTPTALTVDANIEGVVNTRATATAFQSGDAIGITVTSTGNTKGENVKYVWSAANSDNSSKFVASATPIYYIDNNDVAFSAYYPYTDGVSASAPSISASTADQSEQTKFDFLYGNATTKLALGNSTAITFGHKMAKLTFSFVAGTGASSDTNFASNLGETSGSNKIFKIDNLVLEGTFNALTGVAAKASDKDAATLSPTIVSAASSVIIFPQTPAKSLKLTVEYKGVKYTAYATIPSTGYLAGNNYSYEVKVNMTGLTISYAAITDWTTKPQDGVTAGYEYPYDIVNNGETTGDDSGLGYDGDEEELMFKNDIY
jgi:hypothetical protein